MNRTVQIYINLLCIFSLLISPLMAFAQKDECKTKMREKNNNKNINPESDDGRRFVIPVVFHVLYNKKNIEEDPDEFVSDEKLLGLLETLQNDFLATNADISNVPNEFKDKIGNPNIRFVLADTPPVGSTTNGIIRKETSIKEFKFNKRKMFEESPIIDSDKNLNVYVCNINTNGFTPDEENSPQTDGVVIGYWRADKGIRTLTHEVGHWLNLYHIFNGGCSRTGDYVDDTPGQNKHKHICREHPHKDCRNEAAMFMNFMDYSSCRYFFTEGQVNRMRKYIFNMRKSVRFELI